MQHYQKMSNQSTKKSTWIEFVLFKCTREMGINDFGYSIWIAHFISILKRTCEKRFIEYVRLQLNLYPQAGQHAFTWTISPPPSRIRTLWMIPFLCHAVALNCLYFFIFSISSNSKHLIKTWNYFPIFSNSNKFVGFIDFHTFLKKY